MRFEEAGAADDLIAAICAIDHATLTTRRRPLPC
jgi:hypothetical protein